MMQSDAMSNPDKAAVHHMCGVALDACKSLDVSLIGMQNRIDLDMPVDATMVIIEANLQVLNERVESLRQGIE